MKLTGIILCSFLSLTFTGCLSDNKAEMNSINYLDKAETTLDSIYKHYSVDNICLLRENYPFDDKYTATYLASEQHENLPNSYSFLWPYSGTFSAVSALLETTGDHKYLDILTSKVLPGLEEYFDEKRSPAAYASYISSAPLSDRFYDDNVWLGIDFCDVYENTKDDKFLNKAKLIWKFIESGTDENLGGGIYWCEQKKESKNTCSNAPGAVFAFKLFEATGDSTYFDLGKTLYEWTKKELQDPSDFLYFDNISLDSKIGKAKYAYNSGQMMQAAALLYKLTKQKKYLVEAQNIAKSCYSFFFTDFVPSDKEQFKLLKKGDIWFTAVMMRGFIELYNQDNNDIYMKAFCRNLDYAWHHSRESNGLFNTDWSETAADHKKWLLTQAAFVEMYARIAKLKL